MEKKLGSLEEYLIKFPKYSVVPSQSYLEKSRISVLNPKVFITSKPSIDLCSIRKPKSLISLVKEPRLNKKQRTLTKSNLGTYEKVREELL